MGQKPRFMTIFLMMIICFKIFVVANLALLTFAIMFIHIKYIQVGMGSIHRTIWPSEKR